MQEYTDNSTPWFKKYVIKWKTALELRHKEIADSTAERYAQVVSQLFDGSRIVTRKEWAEEFKKTPEIQALLFALLDGKDCTPMIWKLVKPMTKNAKPLVSTHHV